MINRVSLWNDTEIVSGNYISPIKGRLSIVGYNAILTSSGYGFRFRAKNRKTGQWSEPFYPTRGDYLGRDTGEIEWFGNRNDWSTWNMGPDDWSEYGKLWQQFYISVSTTDAPELMPILPALEIVGVPDSGNNVYAAMQADGIRYTIQVTAFGDANAQGWSELAAIANRNSDASFRGVNCQAKGTTGRSLLFHYRYVYTGGSIGTLPNGIHMIPCNHVGYDAGGAVQGVYWTFLWYA